MGDTDLRALFVVVLMGHGKDYIVPKFVEMHAACIAPFAHTVLVGDQRLDLGNSVSYVPALPRHVRPSFCEDALWTGQLEGRSMFLANDFDRMVLQGVDMLWDSPDDVEFFLSQRNDDDAVAALQVARTDSKKAICRRFVPGADGEQQDVTNVEITCSDVLEVGYAGSDAVSLSRRVAELRWWDEDKSCVPWYDRVDEGRPNICAQEWLLMRVVEEGYTSVCITDARPWHCDNDGIARRWPGIDKPFSELHW